eukprot:UN00478
MPMSELQICAAHEILKSFNMIFFVDKISLKRVMFHLTNDVLCLFVTRKIRHFI